MKILKRKGFTLVEIMIVVAIIALLAAIAIPNLLRARLNANEGAATGNIHTLVTSFGSWQANQTPPSYPATLLELNTVDPPYIDAVLGGGTKQGYIYTYTPGAADPATGQIFIYTLSAQPQVQDRTGRRWFVADESGVIRVDVDQSGTVTAGDTPLE